MQGGYGQVIGNQSGAARIREGVVGSIERVRVMGILEKEKRCVLVLYWETLLWLGKSQDIVIVGLRIWRE
jgi:hypothetical protein